MQVVNLQAQLAFMREQAAQNNIMNASVPENPNKSAAFVDHDLQKWFQGENSSTAGTQIFPSSLSDMIFFATQCYGDYITSHLTNNPNPTIGDYKSSGTMLDESASFSSFDMQGSSTQWGFHEVDDLQSVFFGYSG